MMSKLRLSSIIINLKKYMLQDDQAQERAELEENHQAEVVDLAMTQQKEKDAELARLSDLEETARIEKQTAEATATEKAGEEAEAVESKKAL
ncbi:MAG TPA: hypothetical protein DEV73_01355 [Candidatus Zambryskibacteria bacterium]|nr:MAG: hypothetical protein UT25_C0002G0222 [Parcubacteria group bacterium GW2011_GWC1_39_12]KKR19278.1 MAG: hypothetical protein UT49_C0002G0124 [Parcubacteria group bacterium GW2011_GWF1_39_37]KKR35339.1 MAG: hypothetical protein UT68_C0004G0147 [Parcubacteria group bacterium GW2011_GWC2_40_10]KKR52229.1 MAG: hypothetical protein UT89_C0002G0030 [Parcubacteria group bacterium GW2011_GWE1_40_20]KKR65727.1 MAG: hypothetical protein UU06_C0012G0023 [Parcubacteria group bacterium GW2011_GWB1_40_